MNLILVIDSSPGGQGFKNKKLFYESRDILSIYQGGEAIDGENAVSNLLFNSKVITMMQLEKNMLCRVAVTLQVWVVF